MSKQAMKLALEALEWAEFLAENCEATCQDAKHSVDAAITAIKLALTEHEEFTRLKEFCLQLPEVREALAEQPAQQEQEPQTSAQERTEFEQFWVDELGEADELTYGKLGYAIRRVDVAWEAWKAGKISANQQTIVGRKVWIDWKAQALELRELVRLNGIKIAELESAQSAQQEPVEWQHRKPIMDSQGNTRGYSDWLSGKGLEWWPHRVFYASPQPAQKEPVAIALNTGTKQGVKWLKNIEHGEHLYTSPPAQQEPVAWVHWLHGPVRLFLNKDEAQMELERFNREYPVDDGSRKMRPLVFGDTSPPAQRTWVGLTDEESTVIWANSKSVDEAIRATEEQLKENNK